MNYCINRNDRPERWLDAQKEFERMDFYIERFPARVSKNGWEGCRDSHIACLILISKYKEFSGRGFIFEDDVQFLHTGLEFRHHLYNCIHELPDDWDILYLGASPQEPMPKYSPRLYRLGRAFCTHAMMWNTNSDIIDKVLEYSNAGAIGKWDVFLSEKINPHFNVFITKPMLCTQKQYQSDTCKRSDVSTIVKNYNKFAE